MLAGTHASSSARLRFLRPVGGSSVSSSSLSALGSGPPSASAAVLSSISFRFSSNAASRLFMVFLRLAAAWCLACDGEWERDIRDPATAV